MIFCTFRKNRNLAYCILSGFIRFGQRSKTGKKIKPLLDHLAIEAVDELIRVGGWDILKHCLIIMKNNIDNIDKEPVFMHMLSRIIHQLSIDANNEDLVGSSQDICFHLPREKSFTWGWFSYYIAHAFYAGINTSSEDTNEKSMRRYLMNYRKLITRLRKNVYSYETPHYDATVNENDKFAIEDTDEENSNESNVEELTSEYLYELNHSIYAWADKLINAIFTEEVSNTIVDEVSAATATTTASATETITSEEQGSADEDIVIVTTNTIDIKEEPLQVVAKDEPIEKNEELNNMNFNKETSEPLITNGVEGAAPLIKDGVEGTAPLITKGVEGAEPLTAKTQSSWLYSWLGWS
jgi:hypothetical protein